MQDADPEKKKLRKAELLYLSSPEGRKIFPPDCTRLMTPATAVETEASAPDGTELLLTLFFYHPVLFPSKILSTELYLYSAILLSLFLGSISDIVKSNLINKYTFIHISAIKICLNSLAK